ncbi:gamma-glutamyl-gamma-aminobutyrate hydrolase family protein [Luedemannella helvata]|uniref:Gamma-glutamyl-gamma-aminobutyrate hydrolase family protein n=1 Tax=Luedemannella helvata TaxID=349315 RepID=A0ABN2KLD2_9ACTN
MARPLIGLTTYLKRGVYGPAETDVAALPLAYSRSVREAGGLPVLVASDDPDPGIVGRLDGLVLTGGSDVDPARYGAAAHPRTAVVTRRDDAELLLLRAAVAADLPVLGVCRGMQLMVVAAGGRLHQHLPDVPGLAEHRRTDGRYASHVVRILDGTRCRDILGAELEVNSHHHQGVADAGGLKIAALAPDGLVEAVEDPGRAFHLAVQWHPEDTPDKRLFAALVAAAG